MEKKKQFKVPVETHNQIKSIAALKGITIEKLVDEIFKEYVEKNQK